MIRDNRHHHLFINDAEFVAPSPSNRLYFPYSSHDEDGVSSPFESKEAALAAYEQAIQLAPNEATLHYHKGLLLEQLGRPIEAATAYEDANRLSHQR